MNSPTTWNRSICHILHDFAGIIYFSIFETFLFVNNRTMNHYQIATKHPFRLGGDELVGLLPCIIARESQAIRKDIVGQYTFCPRLEEAYLSNIDSNHSTV